MRNLIMYGILLLILSACSKKDDDNNQVLGTWTFVERYVSEGGPGKWSSVEDGYSLTFKENNRITSSEAPCDGSYSGSGDEFSINFECNSLQPIGKYTMQFEDGNLLLWHSQCDEGCGWKFEKQQQ